MRFLCFKLFISILIIGGCSPEQVNSTTEAAADTTHEAPGYANGMVSSAHPIATEAGLAILGAGGNAFDAAVAIASTLNVVEQQRNKGHPTISGRWTPTNGCPLLTDQAVD
jgi:hypothetical protein